MRVWLVDVVISSLSFEDFMVPPLTSHSQLGSTSKSSRDTSTRYALGMAAMRVPPSQGPVAQAGAVGAETRGRYGDLGELLRFGRYVQVQNVSSPLSLNHILLLQR